ncbi:MAG: DNA-primase RepB domain-containing protein [Xanthobacteraceae bacterium]
MERFIRNHSPLTHDLYYCPNAFSRRSRIAKFALPTKFAWCDIDSADPRRFNPPPTTLIETSPGRYQGLWRFMTSIEPDYAEAVSRHLTNTYDGDRGGWSITKMLRVPGTFNHKPDYDLPIIAVLENCAIPIAEWPSVDAEPRLESKILQIDPTTHNANRVIRKYRRFLMPNRFRLMSDASVRSHDRSRIVFMIVTALHNAGASPEEIASVLWVNPYFVSKHGRSLNALRAELSRIISKLKRAE